MIPPMICDACGDPISVENVVTMNLKNVMLAKGQTIRRMHPSQMFWMGIEERHDEFHMCQECGAALSLALHNSRKMIKVAIVKMDDPS